jgi:hypothetical protein
MLAGLGLCWWRRREGKSAESPTAIVHTEAVSILVLTLLCTLILTHSAAIGTVRVAASATIHCRIQNRFKVDSDG